MVGLPFIPPRACVLATQQTRGRLVAVPTTSEGARTRFAQKSALGTGKQRDTLDNEFAELFRLRIGIITRQESDAETRGTRSVFLLVSYRR